MKTYHFTQYPWPNLAGDTGGTEYSTGTWKEAEERSIQTSGPILYHCL